MTKDPDEKAAAELWQTINGEKILPAARWAALKKRFPATERIYHITDFNSWVMAFLELNAEKTKSDLLEKVGNALGRMREKTKEHEHRIEDELKHHPQSLACPHGNLHVIDYEATARVSWGQEKIEPVYRPCDKCASSVKTAAELARLSRMGVPPGSLLEAKIENWKPSTRSDFAIIKTIAEFQARRGGALLLLGGNGLGKSHLSVAVLRNHRSGRFITQSGFLMKLRARYGNADAPDIVEECKHVRCLVLDDIGTPSGGRDEYPALFEVLNHRLDPYNDLKTVLTSQVDMETLEEVFGRRLIDRLAASVVVRLSGSSKRGAK